MSKASSILVVLLILTLPDFAGAQHKGINFQAVIKKPDGTFPDASGLTVTLQVLDPVTRCILREEEHSGKNVSNGYLNLIVGDISAITPLGNNPSPILSITEVMDNSKQRAGLKCVDINNNVVASNQTYIPSNLDRRVLRIRLNIHGDDVVADFNMRAVAFAVNSEMLNSKTDTDFVNINDTKGVNQGNVESVFERYTNLDSLLNNYTKLNSLLGQTNSSGTDLGVNITGNANTATSIVGGINTLLPPQTGQTGRYLKTDGTNVSWETASSEGGLTQVGINLPTSVFANGADITANGQVSAAFTNQNAKTFFAGPANGAGAVPSFRALTAADIPNLGWNQMTGVLSSEQIANHSSGFVPNGLVMTGATNVAEPLVLSPCVGVVKSTLAAFSCAPLTGNDLATSIISTGHILDGAVTDAKISGTISSGKLPVASSTTDGIINQLAQTLKGVKTFLDGISTTFITASGNITTTADMASKNITASGVVSADRIKLANSNATCDDIAEGSLRYNKANKNMEYCNGAEWTQISQGVVASLALGAPSSGLVKSGPVTFDVNYGSGVDSATINLTAADIAIGGTDATGCSVTNVTTTGMTRVVTVDGCTGTGTVHITVAQGTAASTTGDKAPMTGPSASYAVDNSGPNAPTDLTLGVVPNNYTSSPTISYTAAIDIGNSTISVHQVQIKKASDNSVISSWIDHQNGTALDGLVLTNDTDYILEVRALDQWGNIGNLTSSTWRSISTSNILTYGSTRYWSDGTYATSCDGYRNPSVPYEYSGSIGSGQYRIDEDGDGPLGGEDVYCDMTNHATLGLTIKLNDTFSTFRTRPSNEGFPLCVGNIRETQCYSNSYSNSNAIFRRDIDGSMWLYVPSTGQWSAISGSMVTRAGSASNYYCAAGNHKCVFGGSSGGGGCGGNPTQRNYCMN